MPDATGTPTSPDNIPTYNTSGDPPSGKGFNTAMAAIQAALTGNYSRKPAGIVSGEVPVWNGTTWVRSTATNIGASSLGASPDATKVLKGDSTWGTNALTRIGSATVTNTVAATSIINYSIPANTMGNTTSQVRIHTSGQFINNSGAAQNAVRFGVTLGGTSVIDTGTSGVTVHGNSGLTLPWRVDILIINNGATNSQFVSFELFMVGITSNVSAWSPLTGSGVLMNAANSGGLDLIQGMAYNAVAKDMTLAQTVQLNVVLPVASASCSLVQWGATAEVL